MNKDLYIKYKLIFFTLHFNHASATPVIDLTHYCKVKIHIQQGQLDP